MNKVVSLLGIAILLFSCQKDAGTLNGPHQSHDGKYLTGHTFEIGQPPCAPADLSGYRFNCTNGIIPFTGTGYKNGSQIIAKVYRRPIGGAYALISSSVVATIGKTGSFSFNIDVSSYPPSDYIVDIYQASSTGQNPILYGEVYFSTY